MGLKQSHPARTYNLTCNHRREILHTTKGHPSRWNDKTLAYHDDFMYSIHKGSILQDVRFMMLSWMGAVGSSPTVETEYCGAWGLADNGYHRWACTQAPAKTNIHQKELIVSQWIESFRKDCECVFGILKGRFRVLKTGIRLDGPNAADNIWLTCCALHNMLLSADGLDEEWGGTLGQNDVVECRTFAPFAIQRLSDTSIGSFGSRQHEREAIRLGNVDRSLEEGKQQALEEDFVEDKEEEEPVPTLIVDGAIAINSLSYGVFRKLLVDHFDILYRQNKCKWPVRHVNK